MCSFLEVCVAAIGLPKESRGKPTSQRSRSTTRESRDDCSTCEGREGRSNATQPPGASEHPGAVAKRIRPAWRLPGESDTCLPVPQHLETDLRRAQFELRDVGTVLSHALEGECTHVPNAMESSRRTSRLSEALSQRMGKVMKTTISGELQPQVRLGSERRLARAYDCELVPRSHADHRGIVRRHLLRWDEQLCAELVGQPLGPFA